VANGSAGFQGGGISNGGTLTVANSTLSGNSAINCGAIDNFAGGPLTVANSTISGNSASGAGGAICTQGSGTTITDTAFSGNSADSGGGIFVNAGFLTVTNSTFSENSAGGFGGGGIRNQGILTVTNATFSGNSTTGDGGGIRNAGVATVTNATFSGNSASGGGGIHNAAGTLTLRNTIVANSSSGGNCSGAITDGGGNLQYPGMDCGATITSADPMLDPAGLQDNGGPTLTIALQPGSPAIDTAVPPCPPTDQRGVLRPQGAGCDIGAFELEQAAAAADLSLVKTDSPEPVGFKKILTYTLTISNGGPSDATGVSVEDTLPAGVQFVSASPSQGTCAQAGGVVTCDLGSVANGAGATVTITVRVTSRGTLTNSAEVSAAEPDPNPANNSDTETTQVASGGGKPPGCTVKPCP
jgi:uncharacterized repeat protein (TIGR01451 family)